MKQTKTEANKEKVMIVMKKSELGSLLQNAVTSGIKQCINEGIVIGITPKFKQQVKSAKEKQKYYTVKELCELWDISPSTVWRYEKRNVIEGIRVSDNGRRVLFDKETIDSISPPRYRHEDSLEDSEYEDAIMFNVDDDYFQD